ncbi:MAG TPA: ankyrin repeat domain-containing protein, partial [Kineosporiaceae bacterium]|nr:ankyrin repeat domain-containing protein [Kineosporiaceae bacterium]
LADAQLAVARAHGFASWARLKHHLEVVGQYRRAPDDVPTPADPVDAFLTLACLRYGDDDSPERWAQARALLTPDLTRASLPVAAAAADADAVTAHLRRDRAGARREAGPYRWEPLLYLAYARVEADEAAVVGTARLLLDAGADPNAGYLWHGLPSPFTALTGALGGGEGDQPRHPHEQALARVLLDAGADPNDGQTLYNRQFGPDDSHLELLFAYGLGRGDGGPWRARLGPAADTPEEMLGRQLWWAVVHDLRARVRLLARHGVDVRRPVTYDGSRRAGDTPATLAAVNGSPELAAELVALGSPPPPDDGPEALVAALLAGDRPRIGRLSAHVEEVRRRRPALVVWAVARRLPSAVPVLVELGFDVNALGRSDAPIEQPWESGLHAAAQSGDVGLVRLLLDLGASTQIRDARFGGTPLDWARHFERVDVARLLEPLTP